MADWAMGVYRNQNMMGTQSGAAIAAAWAVFNWAARTTAVSDAGDALMGDKR